MNLVNVAVVSFALVAYSNQQKINQQNNAPSGNHPSVVVPTSTLPQQNGSASIPDHTQAKTEKAEPQSVQITSVPDKAFSDWFIFGGNILLVIVGIGGVAIGVCTLRHIGIQTVAIKKQAEHMVESERPFLMVQVLGDENQASFKVSNCGRSPAKILYIDRMLSPTYLPAGENPPPTPEYGHLYRNVVGPSGDADPVNAEWVANDGHTFIGIVSPMSELATLRASLPPQNRIEPCAVWHFGVIVYKGLFGTKLYESRYCYRLLDNQWVMLGPYGYNEYK